MAPGYGTIFVCIIGLLLITECTSRNKRRRQRASRRRPPVTEFPPRLHAKFAAMANNFTWNLYQQMAPGRDNLVFSPISVYKTLSMAYLGTTNSTAKELFNALGYRVLKRPRKVRKAFRHLGELMRRPMRNVSLQSADALFVHSSIHVRNRFVKRLRKFYRAKIKKTHFTSQKSAVGSINKWMRRNTNGMVKDFQAKLSINRRRALWFVNAVYFNGSWDVVFDPSMTNRTMFSVSRYRRKVVDMMFNDWRYYYKINSDLKVKVIEMPYDSHRLSFFLILPDEVDGLAKLERRLTSKTFQELITNMSGPARFHVKMPRMNLANNLDLRSHLKALGINEVFDKKADMSPVDGTRDLYLDQVMHTSVLEVNEGGTVGAGGTGAGIALRSVPPEVKADRPFMFVIKDKVTKTDLFMGKFSNPTA